MKKSSTGLFWFSEINLILWLCMFGFFFRSDFTSPESIATAKYTSIVGFILAALLQHWAYHHIYKPARQRKKDEKHEKASDVTSL